MRSIILIAPPAAGKGTQSKLLTEKYQIPHISTGDLLRHIVEENSELGNMVKNLIDNGQFVDDNIMLQLIEKRITQPDCNNGYILDGFPRNVHQADSYLELLQKLGKPLGDVIYLDLPKETARKRIVGRLSCTDCGAIYNDQFEDSKPLHFGTCDKCGGALNRRNDDNDATFEKRFQTFEEQTKPLLDYFRTKGNLFTVGSGISKERTFREIEKIINR